jgi:energy-converting hydrogenase Eha subunit B
VIFQSGAENFGELKSPGVVGATVVTSSTQADAGEVCSCCGFGVVVCSKDEAEVPTCSIVNVTVGKGIEKRKAE